MEDKIEKRGRKRKLDPRDRRRLRRYMGRNSVNSSAVVKNVLGLDCSKQTIRRELRESGKVYGKIKTQPF